MLNLHISSFDFASNKIKGIETDSYSNYHVNKTIERMCKYIERGFNI